MTTLIGFRHCDRRFGLLWLTTAQPEARWQATGEGPANYFADTPTGAWAEFLRHEQITDDADLAGVRRSLWVVELPDDGLCDAGAARRGASRRSSQLFGLPSGSAQASRRRR